MMILIVILLIIGICVYLSVSDLKKTKIQEANEAARNLQNNRTSLNTAAGKAAEAGLKSGKTINGPGFSWSFSVDKTSDRFMLCYAGNSVPVIYRFSELIAWDVSENGNTVVSSNAGAALGAGLLFGTVGAVAASAGSREIQKSCTSLAIELTLNDPETARRTLPVIRSETPCDSYEYQHAIDLVKNITAELAYIKANAEKPKQPEPQPPKIESPQPSESSEPDIYAQIEKLHALKEKGIITDEEFQKKKHSLLGI